MILLDGKKYQGELLDTYKETIIKENLNIGLDIILIGSYPASEIYVRNKITCAERIGITARLHRLDETVSTEEVIKLIEDLNEDEEATGIILQSPTPEGIDFYACAASIAKEKDIDGFTPTNTDALFHDREYLLPCTVKGILRLLEHYNIDLEGKNVCIIGRSTIVGKPLALALLNRNATVTICHSKTKCLEDHTRNSDIVISATGKPGLIKKDMVKEGFIGIDVGISRIDGHIRGDFDFDEIKDMASFITPVPGGVGPMTIAMIMENLIQAKKGERKNG